MSDHSTKYSVVAITTRVQNLGVDSETAETLHYFEVEHRIHEDLESFLVVGFAVEMYVGPETRELPGT